MERARAFAPGNISGVFKVIQHRDPQKMHSLGMGFTVHEGVTAQVERAPYPSAESIAQANPVAPAIGQAPAIAARPVPTLGSLARSGTTQPSAIAPDPEIALLLARLNQTGDAALRTEPDEPAKTRTPELELVARPPQNRCDLTGSIR